MPLIGSRLPTIRMGSYVKAESVSKLARASKISVLPLATHQERDAEMRSAELLTNPDIRVAHRV